MEDYIVSARKYRPSTFQSVIGQSALTATLKNAILTNHLAHAYLFCGPRGVGKTTCARIFAKAINCQNLTVEGEACNECESCRGFNEQRSFNIHELDAASNNSVEDIRNLIDQVRIPPQVGKYSVYIIDEVHMLSNAAFNSFLKTLEEPPAHAIFILATTEKHKVIPTILSRCQIYDFNRIRVSDTVDYLKYVSSKENVQAEPEALAVIAQKADGGMRDALSIFDQIVSFCGSEVTYKKVIENLNVLDYEYYFKLLDLFWENNVPQSLLVFDEILRRGFDTQNFVQGLAEHFRNVMIAFNAETTTLLEVGTDVQERYKEQAKKCTIHFLYNGLLLTNDCDLNFKQSKNKRLLVELLLIRLCQLNSSNNSVDEKKKPEIKPIFSPHSSRGANSEKPSQSMAAQVKTSSVNEQETSYAKQKSQESTVVDSKPVMMKTISISGVTRMESPLESDKSGKECPLVVGRNSEFTDKQFVQVWKKYAKLHEENATLCNTMLNFVPERKSAVNYELHVVNPFQKKDIECSKLLILKKMSDELSNDFITLSVLVDESLSTHEAFTPEEKFAQMENLNPDVTDLKDSLSLELM